MEILRTATLVNTRVAPSSTAADALIDQANMWQSIINEWADERGINLTGEAQIWQPPQPEDFLHDADLIAYFAHEIDPKALLDVGRLLEMYRSQMLVLSQKAMLKQAKIHLRPPYVPEAVHLFEAFGSDSVDMFDFELSAREFAKRFLSEQFGD